MMSLFLVTTRINLEVGLTSEHDIACTKAGPGGPTVKLITDPSHRCVRDGDSQAGVQAGRRHSGSVLLFLVRHQLPPPSFSSPSLASSKVRSSHRRLPY